MDTTAPADRRVRLAYSMRITALFARFKCASPDITHCVVVKQEKRLLGVKSWIQKLNVDTASSLHSPPPSKPRFNCVASGVPAVESRLATVEWEVMRVMPDDPTRMSGISLSRAARATALRYKGTSQSTWPIHDGAGPPSPMPLPSANLGKMREGAACRERSNHSPMAD